MNSSGIKYKIGTATEEEIYSHLAKCRDSFHPPLNERVNIREYARKLFEKSLTFEAWADDILVGFLAAYLNDVENHSGYVSSVSTTRDYMRMGIASELLMMCIRQAKSDFKEIRLQVHRDSTAAILLYRKFGFRDLEIKNDSLLMKLELNKNGEFSEAAD